MKTRTLTVYGMEFEVEYDYVPGQKLPAEPFPDTVEIESIKIGDDDFLPLLDDEVIMKIASLLMNCNN